MRVIDGVVSLYIVPIDADHVALVDCGMDPMGAAVLAALAERHLRADQVSAVFITHRHGDHVGGCDLFTKARLYALPDAAPAANQGLTVLRDGETTVLGKLRVTAYAVPGHTPDSAAYLAAGVLFLGDAAMAGADGTSISASARRFEGERADPDTEHLNVQPLRDLHARLVADQSTVNELAFGHSSPIVGTAFAVVR